MDLLLLPVHVLCLAVLHALFAFSRLITVIKQSASLFLPRALLHTPLARAKTSRRRAGRETELERDRASARWKKTPAHLAVNFVISALPVGLYQRGEHAQREREIRELERIVGDVSDLVKWSVEVGVQVLSLYDEFGLLESNLDFVQAALSDARDTTLVASKAQSSLGKSSGLQAFEIAIKSTPRKRERFPITSPSTTVLVSALHAKHAPRRVAGNGVRVDSETGESTASDSDDSVLSSHVVTPTDSVASSNSRTPSLFDSPLQTQTSSASSPPASISTARKSVHFQIDNSPAPTRHLKINLLSKRGGRDHLASIARGLSHEVADGTLALEDIEAEVVEERLEGSSISDPDLLIVLGGPYLRLKGFPPWQLRLTEMYHHSSPSWLPSPRLDYSIFKSALDIYGGAEMRLGR